MAALQRTQIGMKRTGTSVNVPNSPVAKLMYYMNTVCGLVDIDDDPQINRLRNYAQHCQLSEDEEDALIVIVGTLLTPDVFIDKCMFHSDAMCGDSSNEFYELEAVRSNLVVSNNIIIGGRRRQVHNIMTFKMSWLNNNWKIPLETLIEKRKRAKRLAEERRRRETSSCIIQ